MQNFKCMSLCIYTDKVHKVIQRYIILVEMINVLHLLIILYK